MKKKLIVLIILIFKITPFYGQNDLTAYIGSNDNKLYAIDVNKKTKKWEFETGSYVKSSAVVAGGVVFVGSYDFKLYAIDAKTGLKKWEFLTGKAISSSPTVADGIVYVGSDDYKIYAIDVITGIKKWEYKTDDGVSSSPIVENGVLFIGSRDKKIYAIDAKTGLKKWEYLTDGAVTSSPTISKGVLYVGSNDYKLYALDALTGKKKWEFLTTYIIFSSPTVVDGVVLFSGSGFLYAVNSESGIEKWRYEIYSAGGSSPTVSNGIVYVGRLFESVIHAIDVKTGLQKWATAISRDVFLESSPIIVNGILYIGGRGDFKLHAIDANTGVKKWDFQTELPIFSSPCLAYSDSKTYHSSISGTENDYSCTQTVKISSPNGVSFCTGKSVQLKADVSDINNINSFRWINNLNEFGSKQAIDANKGGRYAVEATDKLGCVTSSSIELTENQAVSLKINNPNPSFCKGSSADLSVDASGNNPPFSYLWKFGQIEVTKAKSISINKVGTYTVEVTDKDGCSNILPSIVTEKPLPITKILSPNGLSFCPDGMVEVSADVSGDNAPFTFKWKKGISDFATSKSIMISKPDAYSVEVTDKIGCFSSASVEVLQKILPDVNITKSGSTDIVTGGSVTLSVLPISNQTYQWKKDGVAIIDGIKNTYNARV